MFQTATQSVLDIETHQPMGFKNTEENKKRFWYMASAEKHKNEKGKIWLSDLLSVTKNWMVVNDCEVQKTVYIL